jgi:hypothetical protein
MNKGENMREKIEQNLAKLEFATSAVAHARSNDMIDTNGLYYILSGVIEEIKQALEDLDDRPTLIPANHAA